MSVDLNGVVANLESNMRQVVLGKDEAIRMCVVALLAGEHVLVEDVPGVGKTLLGKALARSVDGVFSRIQFTSDLLPSDIVGSSVFNASGGDFVFNRGPIFSNVILADEINRTPPRTQSALLEAMSEVCISVDGKSYELPHPFIVIATQNPFDFEGTYPLPESQLDRFLLRISMGYPDRQRERDVLLTHREGEPVDNLEAVASGEQITELQNLVQQVAVKDELQEYILDITDTTRNSDELHVGISTRGALSLYRAAQALAFVEGRSYIVPDDVKQLVIPVFAHRVIAKRYLHGGQREAIETMIQRLVDEVPVPN